MPDLFHVVPVGDNAMLDGILESENASLRLGLVTDVGIFLSHAHHDTLVAGSTDDRWKHGTGRIITGETRLAHTCKRIR